MHLSNHFCFMNFFRPYLTGALAAIALVSFFSYTRYSPAPETTEVEKKHRIVIQVTTPDTAAYRSVARQINNVLAKWPTAQIEVVAHNKGIGMLEQKKSNVASELVALKAQGIQFLACEQTLKQHKLEKKDILPTAGFVERGIIHIVERQEQDWAYIKGGF